MGILSVCDLFVAQGLASQLCNKLPVSWEFASSRVWGLAVLRTWMMFAGACSWPGGILSHGNEGEEKDCHLSVGHLLCASGPVQGILRVLSHPLSHLMLMAAPAFAFTFLTKMRLGNESDVLTLQLLSLTDFSRDPGTGSTGCAHLLKPLAASPGRTDIALGRNSHNHKVPLVDVDTEEMGAEILQSTGNERALLPWQRAAGVSGRARQSRHTNGIKQTLLSGLRF